MQKRMMLLMILGLFLIASIACQGQAEQSVSSDEIGGVVRCNEIAEFAPKPFKSMLDFNLEKIGLINKFYFVQANEIGHGLILRFTLSKATQWSDISCLRVQFGVLNSPRWFSNSANGEIIFECFPTHDDQNFSFPVYNEQITHALRLSVWKTNGASFGSDVISFYYLPSQEKIKSSIVIQSYRGFEIICARDDFMKTNEYYARNNQQMLLLDSQKREIFYWTDQEKIDWQKAIIDDYLSQNNTR